MSFDNAYEALAEAADDARWAFGTGFHDPLSGVDTTVPDGVPGADLAAYCLMLGDDALILSHRLQEWCTNLPELEEEVAVANIGLDLLGQARLLLTRAGTADGTARTEDDYAYLRDPAEFRNVLLVEQPRGDFAQLIAVLLAFSTWRLALFTRLVDSRDPVLSAIAAKGVKELAYHRDYAARWTIRLGDGTPYSHTRMQAALTDIAPLLGELFAPHPVEAHLPGVAVPVADVRAEFDAVLAEVLTVATLDVPRVAASGTADRSGPAGRNGDHTPALTALLTEMQSVARANPGATW